MKYPLVFIVLTLFGSCLSDFRDGRWFNKEARTVTRILKERHVITMATPSSCVVVQTSLPPCRHLRGLQIQPTQVNRILQTQAPTALKSPMAEQGWRPLVQATEPLPSVPTKLKNQEPYSSGSSLEWNWDIFGLKGHDVTVTKTLKEYYTSRYLDPNTVVTFSVKGCRPSRLPFDLPECKVPDRVQEQNRNVIVMAPVKFVPNIEQIITSPAKNDDIGGESEVESSEGSTEPSNV